MQEFIAKVLIAGLFGGLFGLVQYAINKKSRKLYKCSKNKK